MKILHTEASCGWGGQEIRILEESRGLIGRGHEVTVACPPHASMTEEAARYGVPVAPLPIEFRSIAGFLAIRRHLAAGGYDVVNTHSSADSWLAALACAALPRSPAIVRTRHISAPVSGNFANRWLYRQAKAVVTTGEALRKDLLARLDLPSDKVVSIPTGIDTVRFAPPVDKSTAKHALGLDPALRYIGIVATLRSWKGHAFLLDAFASLPHRDARLVIVGDGPQRAAIERRIGELGLNGHVILAGQRVDPECWLRAFDVFCLPSYANEGVPQALLQAMLCELPIITTPVGAIGEAVQDGASALVVPPKDAAALAAAITLLLASPDIADRLGSTARQVALARFSRECMLDKMQDVFLRACATGLK